MLFSTLKKILKSSPSLYPLFPCSDFVSQISNVGGGWGGGGGNVFLTFSNISRKKNLEIQNNFSFNVFFVFFLYAGNIVK